MCGLYRPLRSSNKQGILMLWTGMQIYSTTVVVNDPMLLLIEIAIVMDRTHVVPLYTHYATDIIL